MNITRELILEKLNAVEGALIPNQDKVSLPIINRLYLKMKIGLKFPAIYVSSNDLMVDGHHRYLGAIMADFRLETVKDYPKPSDLNEFKWFTVDFVGDDWDSKSKIKMLNEKDAQYNGLEIGVIEALLDKKA